MTSASRRREAAVDAAYAALWDVLGRATMVDLMEYVEAWPGGVE